MHLNYIWGGGNNVVLDEMEECEPWKQICHLTYFILMHWKTKLQFVNSNELNIKYNFFSSKCPPFPYLRKIVSNRINCFVVQLLHIINEFIL